ncbi:hypothetical protein Pcinc_030097 [Petrolisthes cinctipes]|uniref:Uncharacterized protein n=1 Tax=Petrolisthes cinctipes TaxID=88211 RepID=A0AAE1K6G8_PETCI|nr:hypothetical protein Pcinc_030097 [Petrolisthes cinctipes]
MCSERGGRSVTVRLQHDAALMWVPRNRQSRVQTQPQWPPQHDYCIGPTNGPYPRLISWEPGQYRTRVVG